MTYLEVFLISVVEGLTEFIPVSSTGHMIVVGNFLGFREENAASFMIIIQLGAIMAAFKVYTARFYEVLKLDLIRSGGKWDMAGWFRSLFVFKGFSWLHILLGILPVMVIGLLFYKNIKELFQPIVVAYSLIAGGVVMVIAEKFCKANVMSLDELSLPKAFLIGCGQCLSLIPGTSRSGATIVSGLVGRLDLKTATDFSFIVSVPLMTAAVAYEALKNYRDFNSGEALNILIGFVISFIVAYFSIRFFLSAIKKIKLLPFGIYRIVFGVFLLYVLQ